MTEGEPQGERQSIRGNFVATIPGSEGKVWAGVLNGKACRGSVGNWYWVDVTGFLPCDGDESAALDKLVQDWEMPITHPDHPDNPENK